MLLVALCRVLNGTQVSWSVLQRPGTMWIEAILGFLFPLHWLGIQSKDKVSKQLLEIRPPRRKVCFGLLNFEFHNEAQMNLVLGLFPGRGVASIALLQ